MKVRSLAELQEALDEDLAWRKRELTNELLKAGDDRGGYRACHILLYAHWEGFIKYAAQAYLELVNRQQVRFGEATVPILALALGGKLRSLSESSKLPQHAEVIAALLFPDDDCVRIDADRSVRTGSNLQSAVLKEICMIVDVDFGRFETKSNMIDQKLLKKRNDVAHGARVDIGREDYEELHKPILDMLEMFRDGVAAAAEAAAYRRPS